MQEMPSNNKKQWLSRRMRSDTGKEVVLISFEDDTSLKESDYCGDANTLEKETLFDTSDKTADVSESDSDLDSEHSFSITSYPGSDDGIPAKNMREQEALAGYCEDEQVGLRLVTPYPSSVDLNEDDSSPDNVQLMSREDCVDGAKKPSGSQRKWYAVAITLFAALVSYYCIQQHNHDVTSSRDTIYVPGAGFSGFWFTLGRLQSIEQPDKKDYYCFSAGCLGVVASLRNFTVDETLNIALNIQERWKTGQIERHDVVGEFVDTLVNTTLSTMSNLLSVEESKVLERMHIITTVKDKWFGMNTHIRSPRTNDELREMLLQTTWM